MNNGGVTVTAAIKSVLDKPLHQLTEDDISQLTREDCRRYLKDKGMRRPSWNKSQAIQQVISLKSLLEPAPPNVGARPSFRPPTVHSPAVNKTATVNSNSSSSAKELSPAEVDGSVSALGEDIGRNQTEGPLGSDLVRERNCHPSVNDSKCSPARCKDAAQVQLDQMTIFYSGNVNVYDGVPVEKQAHTIMHLAASPNKFCQDEPNCKKPANWSSPHLLRSSSSNSNVGTQDAPAQSMLTGKSPESLYCRSEGNSVHEQDVEGHTNRQVSLQRYLEKRKDRGKFKMKRKIGSSPGLEMYLNQQIKTPVNNGQTIQSNTSSTSQPGAPPTGYEMDKQTKNPGLSIDLNDKA